MLSLPAGEPIAGSVPESTQQLHGIFRTLQRRIRPMIGIFLGFIALVLVFSLLVPKSYTTQIKVIAGNSSASAGDNTDSQLPILNALLNTAEPLDRALFTYLSSRQKLARVR